MPLTGGSSSRNGSPHSSGSRKSEIKVSAGLPPSEAVTEGSAPAPRLGLSSPSVLTPSPLSVGEYFATPKLPSVVRTMVMSVELGKEIQGRSRKRPREQI